MMTGSMRSCLFVLLVALSAAFGRAAPSTTSLDRRAVAADRNRNGADDEFVPLDRISAAQVVDELLRTWGVESVADGCRDGGGCSGQQVQKLVETLQTGVMAGEDDDDRDFTAQVLTSASALDVVALSRKVNEASQAGGIAASLLSRLGSKDDDDDDGRRSLLSMSDISAGVWIKHNDSMLSFGSAGDVQLARTGDSELSLIHI